MVEATVNTEEWALRLNKELTEARTRLTALEAQLDERVNVKPLEWGDCPGGGEQALAAGLALYRVHPNGDDWYLVPDHMGKGGKAAAQADYESRILSALEATPPEPKVTEKPLDNDYPISEVASWLTNQATRDYTSHEIAALKLAARILAALTAAQESGQ